MKNIGFFGDLVAYPIEGEKYRIESGHRRYDAAMLADITEVPVFKLNPKMQSLAESGNYSWAILSQASQLNDFQQNMLYRKITMQGSIQSAVSGNWIKDEIDKAKCIKKDYVYSVYREEKPDHPEVKEKTKFRHKDGYKRIEKSYDFLKSAFEDDSIIKANRLEDCLSILIEMQDKKNVVISCGGGVAMRERNVEEMKKNGKVVFLTASPETIYERVKDNNDRPVLQGRKNVAGISELMEQRREKYEAAADIVVNTDDKDVLTICEELVQKLTRAEI